MSMLTRDSKDAAIANLDVISRSQMRAVILFRPLMSLFYFNLTELWSLNVLHSCLYDAGECHCNKRKTRCIVKTDFMLYKTQGELHYKK